MNQPWFLLVGVAVGLVGGPTAPFCGSGSGRCSSTTELCSPGAAPRPLLCAVGFHSVAIPLRAPGLTQHRQVNVPVTGVETSCGHLGKSELYSLSTFLMARPISAAGGKYSTGDLVLSPVSERRRGCGRRGGEGCCCFASPTWERKHNSMS